MEKKVHLKSPRFRFALYHYDIRHGKVQLTTDPKKVTCKRCLKEMAKKGVSNGD